MYGPCHPSGVVSARITASRARILQPNDNHARVNHGLWCRDAGIRGPCQLAGTDDDWRAGHGAAPDEQLQLLDPSVCFRNAH